MDTNTKKPVPPSDNSANGMPTAPWPELELTPSKMAAKLFFPPSYRHTLTETVEWLKKQGVVHGTNESALTDSVKTATKASRPCTVDIARGQPPVEGQDGKIAYNFPSPDRSATALSDKKVDHRETGKIVPVKENQILAEIHPPTDGKPGMTVTGTEVPPKKPHGVPPRLNPGRNVRQEGNQLISTCNGMVELAGHSINVLTELTINTDVDYSVGNIHFPGPVTIRGSVAPGFTVEASGNVLITGEVEDATLNVGGDLIIQQGCVGECKTEITCRGKVQAGFIENSRVEAEGDITVKSHIIRSQIYTDGKLQVTGGKGVIVGGAVHAVRGIEARVLGSKAVVKTIVAITESRRIQNQINEIEKKKALDEQNLEKIQIAVGEQKLSAMQAHPEQIDAEHYGKQWMVLKKLFTEVQALYEDTQKLDARRQELVKESTAMEKGVVRVLGNVYQGVIIQISDFAMEINDDMQAGVFQADLESGNIKIS